MSNLLLRAITALIGVGLMLLGIIFGPWTFAAVFLIILVMSLREFFHLAHAYGNSPFSVWGMMIGFAFFSISFLIQMDVLATKYIWVFPALFSLTFIFPLYRLEQNAIKSLGTTILGIIYIAVPLSLLPVIAFKGGQYKFVIIVGILLSQWANDTGAYFAGKLFGKHKLFESVSPNKTWEGTIGGAILASAIIFGWSHYFDSLTTLQWLGLAWIVVVFGSFGDLVESLFKRIMAIKDSGNSIPGHGGFLDRFDGFLLALPFVAVYVLLLN